MRAKMLLHLSALLLASALSITANAADIDTANIQPHVTLRESGYLIGDLVEENIALVLPEGVALDTDSLPLPGRVAPWMEVRQARAERGDGQGVRIAIVYQIFAEVEQTSRVPIPAFKVRLREGAEARVVTISEQSFVLSPALPPTLTDEDRELKPSPTPRLLPVGGIVLRFAAAFLLALACATYLLWIYDRLPFFPHSPGPFARTWRRWRSRGKRTLSADDHESLLRDWHRAINSAAGQTVYASTLPHLFVKANYLAPLNDEIETLFAKSWQHFYGEAGLPPSPLILDLLRASAERERGVPC